MNVIMDELYDRIDEQFTREWLSLFDNEIAMLVTREFLEYCYENSISEYDDPLN